MDRYVDPDDGGDKDEREGVECEEEERDEEHRPLLRCVNG